jgi:hypothetical protein
MVYLLKGMTNVEYHNPEVVRGLKGGANVHIEGGGKASITLKAVTQ